MNVLLRKVDGIEYLFKDLPEVPVMFPVLWFEVTQVSRAQTISLNDISQSESDLPEYMAGPLNMLIQLPDMMRWCGVCSVLASTAIIFIVIWRILQDVRGKNDPSDPSIEAKPGSQKPADYEYCRVSTNESDKGNDPASAESETSSLN